MSEKEVQELCKDRLDVWLSKGVVIDYLDISSLGKKQIRGRWIMHNKKGRNDLLAYIGYNTTLFVYFIECKSSKGGNWEDEQKDYSRKFSTFYNSIYEIVSNPNQIDITLEIITQYQQKQLDGMKI